MSVSAKARTSSPVRLLLCGLDSQVAAQIVAALPEHEVTIASDATSCWDFIERPDHGMVFCATGSPLKVELLSVARNRRLPVVVVARHADASDYLDAMDAGAFDYITPPLYAAQLRWILHGDSGIAAAS